MGDTDRQAFQKRQIYLQDGARGANGNRRAIQTVFALLFAVTGFVLAIACANVANILLAQVAAREREMSVRLSLGASRYRVVRLLLTEATLLGVAGGAGALAVGNLTIRGMLAILPADGPVLQPVMDTRLLAFTLALGLLTSVAFGLFPSMHGVRAALAGGMHTHTARASGSRTAARFRTSMARTQLALATGLLAVAGLLLVSLVNTARVDLGITREGLLAFGLSPTLNGYTPDQSAQFFDRLDAELRAIPGVASVTATTVPILSQSNWGNNVTVEGFDAGPGVNVGASAAGSASTTFALSVFRCWPDGNSPMRTPKARHRSRSSTKRSPESSTSSIRSSANGWRSAHARTRSSTSRSSGSCATRITTRFVIRPRRNS